MMTMSMQFNIADKARLLNMAVGFPRETYKGLGRTASIFRSRLRSLMKKSGGSDGVDKFKEKNQWTDLLHARQLGGKLADPKAIQMYRQGKSVITIGFVSSLQKYAEYFQTAESRPMTKPERYLFAKLGFPNYPTEYNRPARPLIEPFGKANQANFLKWTLRNIDKILAKAGK